MEMQLSEAQKEQYHLFRQFADEEIAPYAARFDAEEQMPREMIQKVAGQGFLGAVLPKDVGGMGYDMTLFGLLNEQLGRACSSVRSLITVHSMVSFAIKRWGNKGQKTAWLPVLAKGEKIGAFGLSEPNVGSDARNMETTATKKGESYVLNGVKKWTTFGEIADVYLIFAMLDGQPAAFLVERGQPGLETKPIRGLLGTRGSMVAELQLKDCVIPVINRVGGRGFGFAGVALSCLNLGRYSVAWGCVGLGQACLEASLAYSQQRVQFGVPLKDHQLIQQLLTNMYTQTKSARLLCHHAGLLQEQDHVCAVQETLVAKYAASVAASQSATNAVQIHGANGCSSDYPVSRYHRDAKIMEIIEGSTQMQQVMIAEHAHQMFKMGHRLDELIGQRG